MNLRWTRTKWRTALAIMLGATMAASGMAMSQSAVTPKTEAPPQARVLSRAFSSAAKALRPSVVRIDVEAERPKAGRQFRMPDSDGAPFFHRFMFPEGGEVIPRHGTGSGVILDTSGNIVTNRHVVHGASKLTVTLHDGRELAARVVGKDERTDVAVLKLTNPPRDLVAARLGDSQKLEVGEWVLAVGSPLGLEQTVTVGIVSGLGKTSSKVRMSGDRVRSYIQTDAKINPGNSGGPLVNLDGEVVGVNTLINQGPGGSYGFAIPVNEVRRVAQVLMKEGRVRYAYLGVRVGDVKGVEPEEWEKLGRSPKNAPKDGALVSELTPGSPAAGAGLRVGDIITSINDRRTDGAADVIDAVSSHPVGTKVNVSYLREGKSGTVQVALGELPSEDGSAPDSSRKVGVMLQTLTPDLAQSLGVHPSTRGAVITDVERGSPAERAGLRAGEVIVEVDRKPVTSVDEAVAALRQSGGQSSGKGGGPLLRVRSASGARYVTITAE